MTGLMIWVLNWTAVVVTAACAYREAVRFIAANILRLAAAGVDIGGLDSALITNVAKVRQRLLL